MLPDWLVNVFNALAHWPQCGRRTDGRPIKACCQTVNRRLLLAMGVPHLGPFIEDLKVNPNHLFQHQTPLMILKDRLRPQIPIHQSLADGSDAQQSRGFVDFRPLAESGLTCLFEHHGLVDPSGVWSLDRPPCCALDHRKTARNGRTG